MPVSTASLSGRKELLQWLNRLCDSEYPVVESLRDGAAYSTIIEAAVSRIAQNCAATQSPDAAVAMRRAEQAHTCLGKMDWSATAAVCEEGDPSLDSVSVRHACQHNMRLLQDMLNHCVPAEHRSSVDADRLAAGKLQDHVLLLRWLYSFMSKVLSQYSKRALVQKAGTVAGIVEGVKLNRTARMRSGQVSSSNEWGVRGSHAQREPSAGHTGKLAPAPSPLPRSSSRSPHRVINLAPRSAPQEMKSPLRTPSKLTDRPVSARASSSGCKQDGGGAAKESAPQVAAPQTARPARRLPELAEEVLYGKTVHSHYTRGTIAVPDAFRAVLVSLRGNVEELEAAVLQTQELHNFYLTHRVQGATTADEEEDRSAATTEALLANGKDEHMTLSLEELGEVLEERDRLAQQYAAVDAIVTQAVQRARGSGMTVSPLLCDIVELLHPGAMRPTTMATR